MQKRPQKSKVFAAFLVNKNFRTLFTYYYTVMKRKVNQFFAYFEAPEIDAGLYRAGFHAHDPGFHNQFSEQGGIQEWRLEALQEDIHAQSLCVSRVATRKVLQSRLERLSQGHSAPEGVADPLGGAGADPAGGLADESDVVFSRAYPRRVQGTEEQGAVFFDAPAEFKPERPELLLKAFELDVRRGSRREGRADDQGIILGNDPGIEVREFRIEQSGKVGGHPVGLEPFLYRHVRPGSTMAREGGFANEREGPIRAHNYFCALAEIPFIPREAERYAFTVLLQ